MKYSIIFLACLSLTACASQQQPKAGAEAMTDKPKTETESMTKETLTDAPPAVIESTCSIYESAKWHAWLDKGSEDGGLRLNVSGEVTVPSPGYTVSWQMGPMDRAFPPSLRLRLTTLAPPAGQMNIQMLTKQAIDYTVASRVPKYRSIMIICGDELLAEIPDVQLSE